MNTENITSKPSSEVKPDAPVSNSVFQIDVFLRLSENEARALKSLTVYGHKSFLEFFYESLGKHYLQPHERGLISLFEKINRQLPQHLDRADKVRKMFKDK